VPVVVGVPLVFVAVEVEVDFVLVGIDAVS
jgi:hypothetical protein